MAILALKDGRQLDIEVSGPEDGTPLVFHHGTPSSVLQLPVLQDAAARRGLRLVTYSRPGYGRSTRKPGRTVASAAADVAEVLDHLGAPRCVVAGWSGGGPHALATAAGLPDRVTGVLSIAGVGPADAPELDFLAGMGEGNLAEFGLAAQGESPLRAGLAPEAEAFASGDLAAIVEGMSSLLPEPDRAVMAGEFGPQVAAAISDGVRASLDGWIDDDLAFLAPWGFAPTDVHAPAFLWQGGEDLMVPFAHGEWLAAHIPGVTAHLVPGEGHLSIFSSSADAMFDELVATL